MLNGTHKNGGQQVPLEPTGQSQRVYCVLHCGSGTMPRPLSIGCSDLELVSMRGEATTKVKSEVAKDAASARRMMVVSDEYQQLCPTPQIFIYVASSNPSRMRRTIPRWNRFRMREGPWETLAVISRVMPLPPCVDGKTLSIGRKIGG